MPTTKTATATDVLSREIAACRFLLRQRLQSARLDIDDAMARLDHGRAMYENTLHSLETAADLCKQLAALEDAARYVGVKPQPISGKG